MVYEAAVLFAGLPAQWFAVIRRAFGALLLELGSEPARVGFRLSLLPYDSWPPLRRVQTAAWAFPIRPHFHLLSVSVRRWTSTPWGDHTTVR